MGTHIVSQKSVEHLTSLFLVHLTQNRFFISPLLNRPETWHLNVGFFCSLAYAEALLTPPGEAQGWAEAPPSCEPSGWAAEGMTSPLLMELSLSHSSCSAFTPKNMSKGSICERWANYTCDCLCVCLCGCALDGGSISNEASMNIDWLNAAGWLGCLPFTHYRGCKTEYTQNSWLGERKCSVFYYISPIWLEEIQCIRKVFSLRDFFHIWFHYSLFLKLIESFFPHQSTHNTP